MSIKTMEKKAKIEFASVVKKRKKKKKKEKRRKKRNQREGVLYRPYFIFE